MIKTNRVKLNIHYDHIMRDYDIYKLSIKQNEESADGWSVVRKILEPLANHLSPALAVLYRKNGSAYLLFEKGNVDLDEFQSYVNQNGEGLFVEKVDLNDHLSMRPNELCQLFFNSLPNMDLSKKFNNISGKLFYFNQDSFKNDLVTAYQIKVDELDFNESESVVTISGVSYNRLSKVIEFNKDKDKEKLKYILQLPRFYIDENFIFRQVLQPLKEDQCFVGKRIDVKKNIYLAKDLDISNLQTFENSKKGMLYRFFKDIEACFKDYIQLVPVDLMDKDILSKFSNTISEEHIEKLFNDLGINLIDNVDDAISKNILEELALKLRDKGIKNIGFDHDKQFNIVLIHDAKYYNNHKMKDLHTNDSSTQHFTYETCIGKDNNIRINDNVVDKLLNELIVKRDIENGSLSTYQWRWDEPVEFVTKGSVYNEKSKQYDTKYSVLKVLPGGSLCFHQIGDSSIEKYKIYEKVLNKKDSIYSPEMLISTKNYKVLISDSKMMVMPDLKQLYFRLSRYKKNNEISKVELTRLLKLFTEDNIGYYEEIQRILENLNKESYQYQEVVRKPNKSDNLPLISLATSFGKEFVKYCREKHKIIFNPCLKSDVVDVFQNIYILNDEKNSKNLYYYVGKKDCMKFNLNTSCHIRQIRMLEGDFDEDFKNLIFDQLRVDFVRNKDYTVLPFTRKYINEFNKLKRY